jgi:uncharacterized RDD family membrane protein YckC
MWSVLFMVSKTGFAPKSEMWSIALFASLIALYEPLLTVYFCTFGQAVMRMRVRDERTLARISLPQAYSRLFVKYFLGTISILTIPAQRRRQAIHDLTTDTIVIEARDAAQRAPVAAQS